MKGKKLLVTAMAGALAVAQMAMPVMAADGGNFDVTVTTKTALLRVKVPTTLAIAVDQFEKTKDGSQIYSDEFTIENKSEIAVKVKVDSTADLGAKTVLKAKKEDAVNSAEEGEMWVAMAAKTAASSYDDKKTATPTETIADLAETNVNVTTFKLGTGDAAAKGVASQTFYLKEAPAKYVSFTEASNAAAAAKDLTYAQLYELTGAAAAATDTAALETAAATADLYAAADGAAVAASGTELKFIPKGTKAATLAATTGVTATSNINYYTVAPAPTAAASVEDGKIYVYADGTTDATDGAAGFRYIGKLSPAQETWDATAMSKVNIKYEITGVTGTKYTEVKPDCTYGLYTPAPILSASSVSSSAPEVKVMAGVTVTKATLNKKDGSKVEWTNGNQYTFTAGASGTEGTLKLGAGAISNNPGASVTIVTSAGTVTLEIQ